MCCTYNCPCCPDEKPEAWRNDLSKPHKQLRARARTLSTASAVSLCPPPPAPAPATAPGRVLMRPAQGAAGGRCYAHRCQAWRHSALPVCSPSRGVVADTPVGGGPSHAGPCQDPALETQSLSPKNGRLPLGFLGRVGGVQAWLEGLGSQGHPWQGVKCGPRGLGTWFPFVICFPLY